MKDADADGRDVGSRRASAALRLLSTALLVCAMAACKGDAEPVARSTARPAVDATALLVAEAERRGLDRAPALRRAEKRVLAQLVLRDLEAGVGSVPAASLEAGSVQPPPREHRLVAYVRIEPKEGAVLEDDALALAAEVLARAEREGVGPTLASLGELPPSHPRYRYVVEEGAVVARHEGDEGPDSLRGALFAAPRVGSVEPAFRTGRGAYAAFVLAIWPDVRPTPEAEAAERAPNALTALRAKAASDLVSSLRASIPVRLDEEALAPVLGNAASSD